MRNSLQLQLDRLASDRWARRGVRILLRASVLALSMVCLAIGMHLVADWPLRWTWIASGGLICIACGALLVLRPRLPRAEVARRLDRRFRLNEQLTTALEVGPNAEGVGAYLHEQSRRTLTQIRRHVAANQRFPWSDVGLMLALTLLLVGLLVLAGIGPGLPGLAAEPLPQLVTPPDPAAQFPEEPFQPPPGTQAGPGAGTASVPVPGDAAAAAALAEALRGQSVTRPAAEAIDQGDYAGAAQSLRELADQSGDLSGQARSELAEALRDAAEQVAPTNPGLADQLRESAQGLDPEAGSPAPAIDNLADAVEQLGQGGQAQQGQGAQGQGAQGQQGQDGQQGQGGGGAGQGSLPGAQREGNSQRLDVDGVPLELDSKGPGTTPTGGEPSQEQASGAGGTGAGGGFSRGSQSGERVDVGDDPLRIPADLRDVVQDYFSP